LSAGGNRTREAFAMGYALGIDIGADTTWWSRRAGPGDSTPPASGSIRSAVGVTGAGTGTFVLAVTGDELRYGYTEGGTDVPASFVDHMAPLVREG
jgi:hypothetical protein